MNPRSHLNFLLPLCLCAFVAISPAIAAPKLSVGLMTAVDAAPALVARDRGYFATEGVDVEFVMFSNGQERQVALQAGAVDGAMSDLVMVALNAQGGFPLKVVTLTDGAFPFLSNKDYADGKRVVIGLMEASVTNYLADLMFDGKVAVEKVFVNDIPARLELLRSRKIDLAVVPEPVASMGELSGLKKHLIPAPGVFCPDVMAFTAKSVEAKPEAVRAFLRAWDRAVRDIAKEPTLARDILVRDLKLDPRVKDLMSLPAYRESRLPTDDELKSVTDWVAKLRGKPVSIDWESILAKP